MSTTHERSPRRLQPPGHEPRADRPLEDRPALSAVLLVLTLAGAGAVLGALLALAVLSFLLSVV